MGSPLELAGLVGRHGDELWQPGVVYRRQGRGRVGERGGGGPDPPVAVGGLNVEILKLSLPHLVVGLAANKLKPGPAAVGRVAVGNSIAVEPEKILVGHSRLQPLKGPLVAGRGCAKQRLADTATSRISKEWRTPRRVRRGRMRKTLEV